MNYYNDHDLHATRWLAGLITAGLIPGGVIDRRGIHEVRSDDVVGYTQCHFFAGIAGWPESLRLAGWPSDRPVWTASLPCQPFSLAGKRRGTDDERHLWPVFRSLVAECRPPVILGEQVASPDGREWYAGIRADLEAMGYAVGAADLCAAGTPQEGEGWFLRDGVAAVESTNVGAPHIRQRLYWGAVRVADAPESRQCRRRPEEGRRDAIVSERLRHAGRLAEPTSQGRTSCVPQSDRQESAAAQRDGVAGRMDDPDVRRQQGTRDDGAETRKCPDAARSGTTGRLADSELPGQRPGDGRVHVQIGDDAGRGGPSGWLADPGGDRVRGRRPGASVGEAGGTEGDGPQRERVRPDARDDRDAHGFWSEFDVLPCGDDKARRVEPGSFPLVDGVPFRLANGLSREDCSRAEILRGIGNAIVPPLAAEFVVAFWESIVEQGHA